VAIGDAAVAKLGKETGHPERLATLVVDTSKPESIAAAAKKLEYEYAGRLGGLISNAGVRRSSFRFRSDMHLACFGRPASRNGCYTVTDIPVSVLLPGCEGRSIVSPDLALLRGCSRAITAA